MSKRSEEAALEAYPDESFVSVEYADMCRSFFQEGYEQAEKDLGWHSVEESLPEMDEAADKYNEAMSWAWEAPAHPHKAAFIAGAKWQRAKMLKLIESRISEILGDAQPNPILRMELQGIIDKIK